MKSINAWTRVKIKVRNAPKSATSHLRANNILSSVLGERVMVPPSKLFHQICGTNKRKPVSNLVAPRIRWLVRQNPFL